MKEARSNFFALALVGVSGWAAACGASDATTPTGLSPTEDAGTSTPLDGSVPGTPPGPASCGNGQRDAAELCDGDEVACSSLSALYTANSANKAKCRADCGGYDVTSCTFTAGMEESVQPALRDPALWANAQCNEKGAFPLFVQRSASKRWVIRLEGGGACSPAGGAPCYLRPPSLASPVLQNGTAIVDRETAAARTFQDNAPASFADANYALLIYCSSDAWTGTQDEPTTIPADAAGTKTKPWRFSGRANVKAALEILAQRYGLDDGDAETKIFFQGGSAGGHGVLHNVDQVKATFPRATADKRVWALANAASYFTGWRQGDATVEGDWSAIDLAGAHTGGYWEDVLPGVLASWKANLGNEACIAAHPGATHLCFFAAELQKYIADPAPSGLGIPIAIANNLEDPNPQDEFGILTKGSNPVFVPGGQAASKVWGDTHRTSAAKLRWVFAPRSPNGFHGVPFKTRGAGTPSLQQLMDGFVTKGDPDAFSYVDFAPAQ